MHPISTLRKSFHDHIAEFRGKSGLGKTYEIVRIYFWFSIIVVFFLNGIFPKSFYRWYLKTPFWWSAGIIGHAFALWFAWKWFNKWHTGPVPRNIRSQIIFWGQGFISVVSPLLAAGSVAVVIMAIIGKPILLKTSYLYYAANAFLDFIRNGLSPALGVLNGIGGFVSNAYAHDATPRNVAQNVADGGTTSGTEAPVWPANGRVTSEFHEVSSIRNNRLHNGIDIANPVGANVMASDSGIVHDITPGRTGANQVIVNNDDGSRSGYAHVSPSVNVGDRINRGDVVGTTDLSGRSTGGHVHYTYKPNAESDHIDPRQHLRQRE